jgi:NAD(P)-dependent dehydrogenase (short-subunit alcohol dehydrogenase family)
MLSFAAMLMCGVVRCGLVHCAGASQHALAAETVDSVAEALLEINTLAPIRLTQAALPHMLKRYSAAAAQRHDTGCAATAVAHRLGADPAAPCPKTTAAADLASQQQANNRMSPVTGPATPACLPVTCAPAGAGAGAGAGTG